MSFFSILLFVALLIFILAGIGVFTAIRYWKIPSTTETLIISEDTSRTEGCAIGLLIEKKIGKSGRVVITMLPKDKLNPKPITFVAESEKILTLPKGVWMKDKDAIRILPNSAQEWFANMFNHVESTNASTHIINAQREGLERSQAHLVNMGDGELSRQDMALTNDMVAQIIKAPIKEDKAGRPGTYVNQAPREAF